MPDTFWPSALGLAGAMALCGVIFVLVRRAVRNVIDDVWPPDARRKPTKGTKP